MITFFEQCQATDKTAGILKKIAKDKQPKEKKQLNFLSHVAVNQATVNITVNIATTIEAANATAMINDPTIVIKMIGATIAFNATTKT
jgi:hypothetical protein